jgi:hypothetical protein
MLDHGVSSAACRHLRPHDAIYLQYTVNAAEFNARDILVRTSSYRACANRIVAALLEQLRHTVCGTHSFHRWPETRAASGLLCQPGFDPVVERRVLAG